MTFDLAGRGCGSAYSAQTKIHLSARLKQMINNTADPGDRATKMRSLVENIKMQNLFFLKESTYILIYV